MVCSAFVTDGGREAACLGPAMVRFGSAVPPESTAAHKRRKELFFLCLLSLSPISACPMPYVLP